MSFSFSAVIDVAVGLVLVYYIIAIITSGITKWLTDKLQIRAKDLQASLREILEDSGKLDDILLHPWAQNLKPVKINLFGKPLDRQIAKIPPETFAKILVDVLAPAADGKGTVDDVRGAIAMLPAGKAKSQLTGVVDKTVDKVDDARNQIAGWFDEVIINVSSLYGQHARNIVAITALVLVIVANVDSIKIATSLWNAPAQRAVVAAQADEILAEQAPDEAVELSEIPELVSMLQDIEIPLFWTAEDLPGDFESAALKVIGLAITWAAAAQGSPFWYDVLKRLRGA